MLRYFLIVMLLTAFGAGDGKKKGREGNTHYGAARYDEAAAAYRAGLQDPAVAQPLRYGLLNNLGAALFRAGKHEDATEAFNQAQALAPDAAAAARAAYNAGNNAFAQENLEGALERYRKALLADPTNTDAKYNYEYVKRRLQQQQQQQQQQQGGQNDQQQQQNQQQNQQGQDQQQQGDQQQDQQGQEPKQDPQQGQDQQQQDGEGQERDQQRPDPRQMSKEQAERILQALQNEEEKLLRQVQQPKSRPRRVEKDW